MRGSGGCQGEKAIVMEELEMAGMKGLWQLVPPPGQSALLWFQGPLLGLWGADSSWGAAGAVPSPEPNLECRGPRPGSRWRCLSHRGGGTELPGPVLLSMWGPPETRRRLLWGHGEA